MDILYMWFLGHFLFIIMLTSFYYIHYKSKFIISICYWISPKGRNSRKFPTARINKYELIATAGNVKKRILNGVTQTRRFATGNCDQTYRSPTFNRLTWQIECFKTMKFSDGKVLFHFFSVITVRCGFCENSQRTHICFRSIATTL